MTDTITLPREVVEKARRALKPLDHYMTVYDRDEIAEALRTHLAAQQPKPHPLIPLHKSDCALLIGGYQCTCGFRQRQNKTPPALAAEQSKPEPVATVGTQSNAAWKGYDGRWSPPGDPIKVVHLLRDLPLGTPLYAAPPDAEALRREGA